MSNSIKFKGADIPIRISYKQAMFDFKDLGLNLLKLFQDNSTLMLILTDDEIMLQVWYIYVSPHCSSFEDALEHWEPEQMHDFRDKFWSAVINFTNPQMRPALQEIMTMIKKELASPGKNLRRQLSESLEELEPTQNSTPSENSSS